MREALGPPRSLHDRGWRQERRGRGQGQPRAPLSLLFRWRPRCLFPPCGIQRRPLHGACAQTGAQGPCSAERCRVRAQCGRCGASEFLVFAYGVVLRRQAGKACVT